MGQEGFFENIFGKIASLALSNLDLLLSVIVWFILIVYFQSSISSLDPGTIAQVSGGLLLVTVGVAAFFGHNKNVVRRLKTRNTWLYSAYIQSISAGMTIISIFFGQINITLFLFLYSIISTLSLSYAVITEVFELD